VIRRTAISAANDNSARGATRTPSVEQNESAYQQIGSSMTIISDQPLSTKTNIGQTSSELIDIILSALALSGADAATMQNARQVLATGYVYGAWAQAVNDLDNEDLKPVAAMNAEVIQRVASHQPIRPIVDLIEAEKAAQAQAEPGHHPWCLPGACITRRFDGGEPYIEHQGPQIDLPIPDGMDCRDGQLLSADLHALEEFTGDPMVSFNSGGNGVLLDRSDLDKVINNLDGFLNGLRAMRQKLSQEQAK
jgi:hypothetical protein